PYIFDETTKNESDIFLLWDLEDKDNRNIYFWLLFLDRTFSLARHIFFQVYTILAKTNIFFLPLTVHCSETKQKLPTQDLNLIAFLFEFEQSATTAIRPVFSEASLLHGCLFHVDKNMRSKIEDRGLMHRYYTDPDFNINTRMIVAIAFVPLNSINATLAAISANWFEDT
ncbi:hypothetical protein MXB_1947, partial [Myxobolus squamalis]